MSQEADRVRMVQVLTRHQPMIQAYAYAIVRDFHLTEDVYQDVAEILATQWESVPTGDALVPWLRETTRRKALEARRKFRRMPPTLSSEILSRLGEAFEPAPDEGPLTVNLREVLVDCVGALGHVARNVLEARYGEGEPCGEIARRIGRTAQSVYAILKRARIALARCVDRAQVTRA